jgi:hypothetical protein
LRPQHPRGHDHKENCACNADSCPEVGQLQEAAEAEKDGGHEGDFNDPVTDRQECA